MSLNILPLKIMKNNLKLMASIVFRNMKTQNRNMKYVITMSLEKCKQKNSLNGKVVLGSAVKKS